MPNGKDILNQIDFEKDIEGMNDRKLLEFTARQVYTQGTKISTLPCQQADGQCSLPQSRKTDVSIWTSVGTVIGIVLYNIFHRGN